ncbi:hypothetical protein YC2023_059848 [Brassica napus]
MREHRWKGRQNEIIQSQSRPRAIETQKTGLEFALEETSQARFPMCAARMDLLCSTTAV